MQANALQIGMTWPVRWQTHGVCKVYEVAELLQIGAPLEQRTKEVICKEKQALPELKPQACAAWFQNPTTRYSGCALMVGSGG